MSKETIHWSGYEWLTQERFGEIHPKKDLIGLEFYIFK